MTRGHHLQPCTFLTSKELQVCKQQLVQVGSPNIWLHHCECNETKSPTLEGCKPTYFSLFTTCLKDTPRSVPTALPGWDLGVFPVMPCRCNPPSETFFTAEGMKDGYIYNNHNYIIIIFLHVDINYIWFTDIDIYIIYRYRHRHIGPYRSKWSILKLKIFATQKWPKCLYPILIKGLELKRKVSFGIMFFQVDPERPSKPEVKGSVGHFARLRKLMVIQIIIWNLRLYNQK